MTPELKQTAIHSWHESHGGKMTPFAGWHMPLQYHTGAIQEHLATRSSAGLFDISHMGRLYVSGPRAGDFLDSLISSDIRGLAVGMSTYGLLCREDGYILDDVFVFRPEETRYLVVVNAANTAKVLSWCSQHSRDGARVENRTEQTSMLAVQGPQALSVLERLSGFDAQQLPRFGVAESLISETTWQISRTGYTGEEGVEIVIPAIDSLAVWAAFAESEYVSPVGLAARDSLRFEPGFALYGHEISEDHTPVEARLTWACNLDRPFIGRDAIIERKQSGVSRRLATFTMEKKAVPRQGCLIRNDAGEKVGTVATGMYSPTLDVFAGNAFLDLEYAKIGSSIAIEIRGRAVPARIVKRPLFRPTYRD